MTDDINLSFFGFNMLDPYSKTIGTLKSSGQILDQDYISSELFTELKNNKVALMKYIEVCSSIYLYKINILFKYCICPEITKSNSSDLVIICLQETICWHSQYKLMHEYPTDLKFFNGHSLIDLYITANYTDTKFINKQNNDMNNGVIYSYMFKGTYMYMFCNNDNCNERQLITLVFSKKSLNETISLSYFKSNDLRIKFKYNDKIFSVVNLHLNRKDCDEAKLHYLNTLLESFDGTLPSNNYSDFILVIGDSNFDNLCHHLNASRSNSGDCGIISSKYKIKDFVKYTNIDFAILFDKIDSDIITTTDIDEITAYNYFLSFLTNYVTNIFKCSYIYNGNISDYILLSRSYEYFYLNREIYVCSYEHLVNILMFTTNNIYKDNDVLLYYKYIYYKIISILLNIGRNICTLHQMLLLSDHKIYFYKFKVMSTLTSSSTAVKSTNNVSIDFTDIDTIDLNLGVLPIENKTTLNNIIINIKNYITSTTSSSRYIVQNANLFTIHDIVSTHAMDNILLYHLNNLLELQHVKIEKELYGTTLERYRSLVKDNFINNFNVKITDNLTDSDFRFKHTDNRPNEYIKTANTDRYRENCDITTLKSFDNFIKDFVPIHVGGGNYLKYNFFLVKD